MSVGSLLHEEDCARGSQEYDQCGDRVGDAGAPGSCIEGEVRRDRVPSGYHRSRNCSRNCSRESPPPGFAHPVPDPGEPSGFPLAFGCHSSMLSVCCIEVPLLPDSQEVHEAGHTDHPEDRRYHVDDSMPHVPIAEGEVRGRGGPQAAGEGAHAARPQGSFSSANSGGARPAGGSTGSAFRLPGAHPFPPVS